MCQIEKEGGVFVVFDEGDCFVGEEFGDVCSLGFFEGFFIAFPDQLFGLRGFRPKGEIKTLVMRAEFESEGGGSSGSSARDVPLSSHARLVSLCFEDFGKGDFIERHRGMGDEAVVVCCSLGAHGIAAGKEGRACGSADGLGIEAGELHSLLGHLVDPRRPDVGGAIAAEVLVALVIGQDDDEVGLLFCCCRGP